MRLQSHIKKYSHFQSELRMKYIKIIFLKVNIKLLINKKKKWNTIIRFGRKKKNWKDQRYRVTEGIK